MKNVYKLLTLLFIAMFAFACDLGKTAETETGTGTEAGTETGTGTGTGYSVRLVDSSTSAAGRVRYKYSEKDADEAYVGIPVGTASLDFYYPETATKMLYFTIYDTDGTSSGNRVVDFKIAQNKDEVTGDPTGIYTIALRTAAEDNTLEEITLSTWTTVKVIWGETTGKYSVMVGETAYGPFDVLGAGTPTTVDVKYGTNSETTENAVIVDNIIVTGAGSTELVNVTFDDETVDVTPADTTFTYLEATVVATPADAPPTEAELAAIAAAALIEAAEGAKDLADDAVTTAAAIEAAAADLIEEAEYADATWKGLVDTYIGTTGDAVDATGDYVTASQAYLAAVSADPIVADTVTSTAADLATAKEDYESAVTAAVDALALVTSGKATATTNIGGVVGPTDDFESYTVDASINTANSVYTEKNIVAASDITQTDATVINSGATTAVIKANPATDGTGYSLYLSDDSAEVLDNDGITELFEGEKPLVSRAITASDTGSIEVKAYVPEGNEKSSYINLGTSNSGSSSGRFTELVLGSTIKFRAADGSQYEIADYNTDEWITIGIAWDASQNITITIDGTDYTTYKTDIDDATETPLTMTAEYDNSANPTYVALYCGDNGSEGTYVYFDDLDSELF